MRLLIIAIYVVLVIVLQSVVFARLNLFGVSPDLVLISVVSFAVLQNRGKATVFAASAAFLQDILSFGVYLNTVTRVLISALANNIKDSFAGNEYALTIGLVLFLTPVVMLLESGFYVFFQGRQVDPLWLLPTIALAAFYNMALSLFIFPVVKMISHA